MPNTVHVPSTVCTSNNTGLRKMGASLRPPTTNNAHVHVQFRRPSTRAYVLWAHRLGYPCSLRTHIHAPTYNGGTFPAIHVDHCASASIACTPTSTYPRTIDTSLRPPMPNTVHVHTQGASQICTVPYQKEDLTQVKFYKRKKTRTNIRHPSDLKGNLHTSECGNCEFDPS